MPARKTNLLVAVTGVIRSGNHVFIDWLLTQFKGKRTAFFNNLPHNLSDPWLHTGEKHFTSIGATPEELLAALKDLIVVSYEDRKELQKSSRLILQNDRADMKGEFADNVGGWKFRKDAIIIRDFRNCMASRYKMLQQSSFGGADDWEHIKRNWKHLATTSLKWLSQEDPDRIVVYYDVFVKNKKYREDLSIRLGGKFCDESLDRIPPYGGGSSFSGTPLSPDNLFKNWRKVLDLKRYRNTEKYLKRIFAPKPDKMQVHERWKSLTESPDFQKILSDEEALALSKSLDIKIKKLFPEDTEKS